MSRAIFLGTTALLYACTIVVAVLRLNAYFAQTWDVNTFIQAAHRFLDGGNPFDLYAVSRVSQTWPYAYPPLHAFVVAVALFVGGILPLLPDYVWARVPVILADIGVGLALYEIVARQVGDGRLARAALLLWLFNPVAFYNTAVQGHFESEWLLFVILAYALFERSRGIALPAIALAIAFLFKQIAILFAIPLWLMMLKEESERRRAAGLTPISSLFNQPWARAAASVLVFAAVVGAVCLPYLLYSSDFVYMNLTYVENVPVQTQSWIVGLLGVTRASSDALTSDFFLLRYQTIVTMLAAAAIGFFGARRGFSLYLTATLIALAVFLTSKKVMGYYYVMLFPFLIAEVLPRRRFDLALVSLVATVWVSLSPYYAAWGNPDHWWIYALLGALNSLVFVWLFVQMWRLPPPQPDGARETSPAASAGVNLRTVLFVSSGLFASAAWAAFLQPLAQNAASPIRAPVIAPGMEWNALLGFVALLALVVGTLALAARVTRGLGSLPRAAWGIVLVMTPLFFAAYYLTKESTAIFETALKALGV